MVTTLNSASVAGGTPLLLGGSEGPLVPLMLRVARQHIDHAGIVACALFVIGTLVHSAEAAVHIVEYRLESDVDSHASESAANGASSNQILNAAAPVPAAAGADGASDSALAQESGSEVKRASFAALDSIGVIIARALELHSGNASVLEHACRSLIRIAAPRHAVWHAHENERVESALRPLGRRLMVCVVFDAIRLSQMQVIVFGMQILFIVALPVVGEAGGRGICACLGACDRHQVFATLGIFEFRLRLFYRAE